MSENLHIAEIDLALYALGALPPPEAENVAAHVRGCAVCREELRQNALALNVYAQATPAVSLPEGSRDRFLSRIAATPQTQMPAATRVPQAVPVSQAATTSSWRSFFSPGAAKWSFAFSGALAIALAFVAVDDLQKRAEIPSLVRQAQRGALDSAQLAQLMDLLTSQQTKRVALHQAPVAHPAPEGSVVYEARTGKLLLTASNLQPLPSGKTYELWILQPDGKKPLPAGTFEPDSSGSATMILADAPANLAVQGFGVTVENAGGSPTPTLPIVLSGL